MVTLGDYLIVSGVLFAIGFAGVMLRRNLIIILMSLELMLNAPNLSLVAFSRFRVNSIGLPDYNARAIVFFIVTVAPAAGAGRRPARPFALPMAQPRGSQARRSRGLLSSP